MLFPHPSLLLSSATPVRTPVPAKTPSANSFPTAASAQCTATPGQVQAWHAPRGSPAKRGEHFLRQGISRHDRPRGSQGRGLSSRARSTTTSNPKTTCCSGCSSRASRMATRTSPGHIHQDGDPVEQLERAIRAQIDYIIEHRVPFGLFLHEFDSLSGKRQHKLISVMSRYNNRFVELVRKGQEQGKLIEGERFGSSSTPSWGCAIGCTAGMTTMAALPVRRAPIPST